jgi:hypothetical protein
MKTLCAVGLIVLIGLPLGYAQEANPGPTFPVPVTAKAKRASPETVSSVALTDEEETEIELGEVKSQNLALRIQVIQRQIADEQAKQKKDLEELVEKLAKVHHLDLAKWHFDQPSRTFLPNPKEATKK